MRTLTWIAALSAALLMAHSAFAASAVVKACRADIKTQCGDEAKSGGAALKDCMQKHFSDLSEDCQVAIIRAAAVGKACRADAKKLCADVKREKGAMAECMKSHAADLSDGCKQALAKSGAGGK
jgi:Cysteine rich repeat